MEDKPEESQLPASSPRKTAAALQEPAQPVEAPATAAATAGEKRASRQTGEPESPIVGTGKKVVITPTKKEEGPTKKPITVGHKPQSPITVDALHLDRNTYERFQ